MTLVLVVSAPILLLLFLPIRVGGWARCTAETGLVRGWVRPWNGLCGIQVVYAEKRLRVGPTVWRWAPWSFLLKRDKRPVSAPEAPAGPGPERPDPKERRSAARLSWSFLKELRRSTLPFVMRIVRGLRIRRLSCDVVFGASDPVTTGQLFGYTQALSGAAGPRVDLALVPDFDQERLEGEAEVELTVYAHRIVWAVACLACRAGGVGVSYYWNAWRERRRTH